VLEFRPGIAPGQSGVAIRRVRLLARGTNLAGVLGFDPTRTGFGVRPASHGSPLNWLAALGSNQSQSRVTTERPHPED
jgi:hypothetical protein